MRLRTTILIVLMAAAAAAGFATTLAVKSPPAPAAPSTSADSAVCDFLNIPADQRQAILDHDPAFSRDLKKLRDDLAVRRSELALALGRAAPDPDIRAGAEAVIAAQNTLERRVTDHLLTIRHHLTPAQQKKLFDFCAQGIRQGCGGQWRDAAGKGPCSQPGWRRGRQ